MGRHFDYNTALQEAKRWRRVKSTPSLAALAKQYFDLQRLRRKVEIAVRKIDGQKLTGSQVGLVRTNKADPPPVSRV